MTRRPETYSDRLGIMPQERQMLDMGRYFAPAEVEAIRRGYEPRGKRNKWIVVMDEASGYLRFYRRERGYCIYEMRLEMLPDGDGAIARRLTVNRDHAQHYCWCDEDEVRMCNYLIDLLLLDKVADFPLPLDGPQVEQKVAEPTAEELPQADNETDVLLQIEEQSQGARQRCL